MAEELINEINSGVFFREFTFKKYEFKPDRINEVQLADSIVWIDDIFLIYQVKTRKNSIDDNDLKKEKWFKNKVLKVAKDQIKTTLNYFKNCPEIVIKNNRGFEVNLKSAPVGLAKKLIIYEPGEGITDKLRFVKSYISREVGIIHLFHFEDYYKICQYLFTPNEISDYLRFREELIQGFSVALNSIPEQLILAYYISGEPITALTNHQIELLRKFQEDISEFDISGILNSFYDKIIGQKNKTDYFHIVKELAKLKRHDLRLFKSRYQLAFDVCKKNEVVPPYRMASHLSGCGFIFIPLPFEFIDNWENGLNNYTIAHKYDMKVDKCIGVIFFKSPGMDEYYEVYWMYLESKWEFDEVQEEFIKTVPLRPVKTILAGGYNIHKI